MTEQNALGFEGDIFLKAEFERLIKKHNTRCIVETGTYLGNTTLQLSKMVEQVYTIEINKEYFNEARLNLANTPNVQQFLGDSVHVLPKLVIGSSNVLFFLDAHWNAHNPLLEELAIIASFKLKPVIIVHDFKVPNHPELGYDSYNGQDYDYTWIEDALFNIYGNIYSYYYNTEATGAKRGVIFIEPI